MATFNITQIEDDPLTEVDAEDAIKDFDSATYDWFWMTTDIIKFFICLALISADLFMIITMRRNKKLKTKANDYILNYFIFNLLYFCSPIFWIFIEVIPWIRSLGPTIFCVVVNIEDCSIVFCYLFAGGLALDWLVTVHNPSWGQRFQKLYSHSILLSYSIGFVCSIIIFITCNLYYLSSNENLGVVFSVSVIFLTVCNYLRYKTKAVVNDKKSFGLTISSVMIYSWLPLYVHHFMLSLTTYRTILHTILSYTIFIPDWLCTICPIIIIVMLGKLNKNYRIAYDRAFRRDIRNYEDDEEDFEESEDTKTLGTATEYANITSI